MLVQKERHKEEVNGLLALLGVAAGLAAEANTGKTICDQVRSESDCCGQNWGCSSSGLLLVVENMGVSRVSILCVASSLMSP